MVRAATRSLGLLAAAVMLATLGVLARLGFGLPAFLVLTMVSICVFGTREKWAGEPSAYSVFNEAGRRLPGQLTAEQFEAELLGSAPEVVAEVPTGYRLGATGSEEPPPADGELRRRLLAQAAERRLQPT